MLEDREPLTIKQFLLDLKYGEDMVDYILRGDNDGDEDGDSNGNGIDDRDRDNARTSDGGDNEDDASSLDVGRLT